MNIISAILVLTFGVLMPNQCRCDSVQVNNDISGFQFELLLTHLAAFQSAIEDRYDSSLTQITSILERLESRMDALESYMEKRFENSTSQLMTRINQTEAKADGFKSHAETRFEQVAHKIDAFKALADHRYKANNNILRRWEGKVDELKLHIENRIENSASQIITKMNQHVGKIDGFESRLANQIENNSSQIIDTFDRQIKVADSNVARRIETSSSQCVDMMRHLHTKVDVLDSHMKERYDNISLIAERLEGKGGIDIGIMNLLHQSPMHRLDKYVQDLGISSLYSQWITIQQRFNGSVDFFQNWNAYKKGFGHQDGEYWIGLQSLYQMTQSARHELLIVLEDFDGKIKHALFDDFKIGSEDENYVLEQLGEYSGTVENSFQNHVGESFSTYDRDNDKRPDQNCASELQGGWWFTIRYAGDCISCNLNGKYYHQPNVDEMQGLNWYGWHGDYYSLKSTKMMIRGWSAPRRTIADRLPRIYSIKV